MNYLWQRSAKWLVVPTLVAMLMVLVAGQGTLAQDSSQSLDLSTRDGDVVIDSGGTWVITGSLEGRLSIDIGDEDIILILDGVDITNGDGPAIAVLSAGEVTIETAADSLNTLADGGTSEMDAALWAETNLTFTGQGTMDITAIYEGIETTGDIVIESGTILIHAGEDGINANTDGVSQIVINGGTVFVETIEGDGIDSNGGIEINGGTVVSYGALVDGNSGLDADLGVVINGGTVVASGSQMAAIDASSQQQYLWASFDGTLAAGTGAVIRNSEGVVIAAVLTVDIQSLIISTESLDTNADNELLLGGTFEVDETSLATGTVTDAGESGGTLSETNPGGRPGRP